MAPTAAMRMLFGDNFFYSLYFQQPGVAFKGWIHRIGLGQPLRKRLGVGELIEKVRGLRWRIYGKTHDAAIRCIARSLN